MQRLFRWGLLACGLALLASCAAVPEPDRTEIARLADAIRALGPEVDAREADRAARIAFDHALALKAEWRVTDPPLIHNAKVHAGTRDYGLCNDWARAMIIRLRQERFRTLDLHWATSPPATFRIIHHTAVIGARGAGYDAGIVLDPWRNGGVLHWAPVAEDTRYNWRPRMEVRDALLAASRARRESAAR